MVARSKPLHEQRQAEHDLVDPVAIPNRRSRRIQTGRSGASRSKPPSASFLSDGVASVGQRTNLRSPYSKEVTIRPL